MRQELLKILTTDDIEEIISTARLLCDNLVRPTSQNILRHLLDENDCPPSIGERFPFVLSCAEIAVGRKVGKERCEDNTLIRSFVSYQLRKEEYGYCEIGRMLGRDHSTVIYLFNKMNDMLSVPNAYRVEMEKWKEFQRLVVIQSI